MTVQVGEHDVRYGAAGGREHLHLYLDPPEATRHDHAVDLEAPSGGGEEPSEYRLTQLVFDGEYHRTPVGHGLNRESWSTCAGLTFGSNASATE